MLVFQQRRLFPFPLISASKDHKSGICHRRAAFQGTALSTPVFSFAYDAGSSANAAPCELSSFTLFLEGKASRMTPKQKAKPQFDLKGFLNKANGGRTISKYSVNARIFM